MTDARIVLLPEAREDFGSLDGAARKAVAKGIEKLRTDPALRGSPLGSRQRGDLTGYRKLTAGDRTYRIVFRVERDGTVVVVFVIAGRADDEVYRLAVERVRRYENPVESAILRQIVETAWGQ